MLPWYVVWALRKAGVVPAIIISGAAVGASYGSFDLAYRVSHAALPTPTKPRKYTSVVAGSSAILSMLATVGFRETVFKPIVPEPPNVPLDGVPLDVRIRNASTVFMHRVVHYPYQARFITSFFAGTVGGVVYALVAWGYNRQKLAKEESRGSSSASSSAASKPSTQQFEALDEVTEHEDTFVSASALVSQPHKDEKQEDTGASRAQQRKHAQDWHASTDPLAMLGLYSHDTPVEQPGIGAGVSSALGGGTLHAGAAAAVAGVGDHDSEFLETYSDRYSNSNRDSASRLSNGEVGEEEHQGTGGRGNGQTQGQAGAGGQAGGARDKLAQLLGGRLWSSSDKKSKPSHPTPRPSSTSTTTSSWDATSTASASGVEDGGIRYDTVPTEEKAGSGGARGVAMHR